METNCLLELQMEEGGEILSEGNLKSDIREGAAGNVNDVDSLLLDTSGENTGTTTYSTTGIDFEFVNPELGSGPTYPLDHSSVFDISEPVIEEKSELFRDSGVFDDCITKQSELEKQQNASCDLQTGKKLIMDLGLRLQIIPLNNLKLVSTIQTSEGVHFVALPGNSSISQNSVPDQPMIQDIVQHLNSTNSVSVNNVRVHESREIGNVKNDSSKTKDVAKFVELKKSDSRLSSIPQQKSSGLRDIKRSLDTIGTLIDQHSKSGTQIKKYIPNETLGKKESFLPNSKLIKHTSKSTVMSNIGKKGHYFEAIHEVDQKLAKCQESFRAFPKESKIIIDLRKLMPKKNPRRMISLLNSPKTYRLHTNGAVNMNLKKYSDPASNIPSCKITSNTALTSANMPKMSSKPYFSKKCTVVSASNKNKMMHARQKKRRKSGKPEDNQDIEYGDAVRDINEQKKNMMGKNSKHNCKVCQAKFIRTGNYRNHLNLHKSYIQLSKDKVQTAAKTMDVLNSGTTTDFAVEDTSRISKFSIDKEIMLSTNEKKAFTSVDQSSSDNRKRCQNLHDVAFNADKLDKEFTSGNSQENHHGVESTVNYTCNEIEKCDLIDLNKSENVSDDKNPDEEEKINDVSQSDLRCHICQLTLSSVGNLTRHKMTHMNKTGRYGCAVCNKTFHQQCDLKRHETVHSGNFPYDCKVCSKGFLRKDDLSIHEHFHTREKKHSCDKCSKSYFQSGDLKRHIRQVHKDLCNFSCVYCFKKYTTQRSLFTHVRSKHM